MNRISTKIQKYDLEDSLIEIIDDIIKLKGIYDTVYDRFIHINSDLFDTNTKAVIDDLIRGYENGGILTIQRIENLKRDLESAILKGTTESGDYDEKFEYDERYGNIIRHTTTGDKEMIVEYSYRELASGELSKSVQTFANNKGQKVTVTKIYSYDPKGNITGIKTRTEVDVTAPADIKGLVGSSPSQGVVNLEWVNPTDADLDKINVYIDNIKMPLDTTKRASIVLNSISNGEHTFTLKSVDTSKNESVGTSVTVIVL
ncbi:hypothetical protein [Bacillus thuringiensis]|uniref:hypothetical protein n=1 Tax=Bacillus thuringiensis TaxID=1428 RepID=UPI0036705AFB